MIGTISSVIVGVVICVAGASKIASGQRWPIDAVALGTPDVLVPVVPWFEIILGALLVAHIAPVITGMIALVLLAVFSFLIVLFISSHFSYLSRFSDHIRKFFRRSSYWSSVMIAE